MADVDGQRSIAKDSLKLSINAKSDGQLPKQTSFNIFSMKIRSNQQVAFKSLIEGNRVCKLQNFVYEMQELVTGSHLKIYLPDINDPKQMTATKVFFTQRNEGESSFTVVDGKDCSADKGLLVCLKIFMSLTSMMKEMKNLVEYLCILKLMNPQISLYFQMDGSNISNLDLTNHKTIKCGSQSLYVEPHICLLRNPVNNFICGTPILQHSESKQTASSDSSPISVLSESASVSCFLCIIPLYEKDETSHINTMDNKVDSNVKINDFVYGQASVHVYNKTGLPVDMISFLKDSRLQPDSLISWEHFGIQMKKATHRCYPYRVEWSVRLTPNTPHPPQIASCEHFLLNFSFVVHQKEHSSLADTPGFKCSLEPFRECADSCMRAVFLNEQHELVPKVKPLGQPVTAFDYWIPDIAKSLDAIFTRSTNAKFRAIFGNHIPANTSIECHLESSLCQVIRHMSYHGIVAEEPQMHTDMPISGDYCKSQEDDRHKDEIHTPCQSPNATHCSKNRDIFTPDSLDNDDHDWDNGQMRTEICTEVLNDEECPLNCVDKKSVSSSIPSKDCDDDALVLSFFQNNHSKDVSTFHNGKNVSEHEIPLKPFVDNFCVEKNAEGKELASCQKIIYNETDKIVLENKTTTSQCLYPDCSNNLNTELLSFENCPEIHREKMSTFHQTRDVECSFTEEGRKGRFIKKRSFEESEASSTCDDFEIDMTDWVNLEDDLDQMKKLRLCDHEIGHATDTGFYKNSHCLNIDNTHVMYNETHNSKVVQCRDGQDKNAETSNKTVEICPFDSMNTSNALWNNTVMVREADTADTAQDSKFGKTQKLCEATEEVDFPNIKQHSALENLQERQNQADNSCVDLGLHDMEAVSSSDQDKEMPIESLSLPEHIDVANKVPQESLHQPDNVCADVQGNEEDRSPDENKKRLPELLSSTEHLDVANEVPQERLHQPDNVFADVYDNEEERSPDQNKKSQAELSSSMEHLNVANEVSHEGIQDCAMGIPDSSSLVAAIPEPASRLIEEEEAEEWFDSKKITDWYESLRV